MRWPTSLRSGETPKVIMKLSITSAAAGHKMALDSRIPERAYPQGIEIRARISMFEDQAIIS